MAVVALTKNLVLNESSNAGGNSFSIFSNNGGSVKVFPEFDYKEGFRKDATRRRSLSGAEFVYQWGYFKRWKFSVKFINSADATQINSWWMTNEDVRFKFTGGTAENVHIVNRNSPFRKRMRGPYELFEGSIELETYE